MIKFGSILANEFNWFLSISLLMLTCALTISILGLLQSTNNTKKPRRVILLVLNLIAFLGLSGLLLQPQIKLSGDDAQLNKVRLISNHSKEFLPKSEFKTYSLDSNVRQKDITIIKTPEQLLVDNPNLQEIQVIGDGLSERAWKRFENIRIDFQPPSLKPGFIDVNWNKSLNRGDSLRFSARFQSDEKGLMLVQLLDPAGDVVDEKIAMPNEYISLQAIPKLAGLHEYQVIVRNDKEQVIMREAINLQVRNQSGAKLLVIQSSPSFETKQLQNWAAENGAQILTKTRISRDRFITRKTNLSDFNHERLSPELFDFFDMLVIDGRGLSGFTEVEIEWLKQAIIEGLGVLVLIDQSLLENQPNNLAGLFSGVRLKSLKKSDEVIPYWSNNNGIYQSVMEEFIPRAAISIEPNSSQLINLKRLVESQENDLLVHQNSFGLGNITLSVLSSTHQWVTSGNKNIFSEYWKNLIFNVARKKSVSFRYPSYDAELKFEGVLAKQCLLEKEQVDSISLKHAEVTSIQHELLLQKEQLSNYKRCGYYWPERSGWYQVTHKINQQASQTKNWTYVESPSNWLALQQAAKIKATIAKQSMNNMIESGESKSLYQPINLWIFWWMFLISATLIWLERKFGQI